MNRAKPRENKRIFSGFFAVRVSVAVLAVIVPPVYMLVFGVSRPFLGAFMA
jgi:hypothetical protein